ncbi:helix-turn-helix domain-containing protein [Photobacterium profundum]|nr:helix-turn-helix domain-containing protein [Photobacterium profundum]
MKRRHMITKQANTLQTLHKHTQLVAFLRDDFSFLRFKRHQNYKKVLTSIAKHADKSKDWSCYRNQTAIAKELGLHIRTVKRAIAMFIREDWLEVIGREVRGVKDGGALLGRNFYRFTNKLLNLIGLQRDAKCKSVGKLQQLWNACTAHVSKLSRSF